MTRRMALVLLAAISFCMFVAGACFDAKFGPAISAYLVTDPTPNPLTLKRMPPDTIIIGPFHWNVRYLKSMPMRYGMEVPESLQLQIDPGLPPDQTKETLVHEILHACIFVGNRGSKPSMIETDDEYIEASAPTFMQVLRDNPELVKWLQEKN